MDSLFNLDSVTVTGSAAVALFIFSKVAELVGKSIPDTVTGWKAYVRKFCKVIGMYVTNKEM